MNLKEFLEFSNKFVFNSKPGWTAHLRRFLDESNIDVNERSASSDGLSLLHYAAGGDEVAAVQLLLDRGADVNLRNDFGQTPLHAAADSGTPANIRCLVENGADIDAQDNQGNTALHIAFTTDIAIAVEEGLNFTPDLFRLAKELVRLGANKNLVNHEGKIPRDLRPSDPRYKQLFNQLQ